MKIKPLKISESKIAGYLYLSAFCKATLLRYRIAPLPESSLFCLFCNSAHIAQHLKVDVLIDILQEDYKNRILSCIEVTE